MSFGGDLEKFERRTTDKMERAVRKIALDVFESVIRMSPVDTGRFRGNWQPAIGMAPSGTLEAMDPSGNTVIAKVAGVTGRIEIGDVIYMVNNLPYAERLEDGYSGQAPNGMVRLTVQRFIPIVDAVIAQVGRT